MPTMPQWNEANRRVALTSTAITLSIFLFMTLYQNDIVGNRATTDITLTWQSFYSAGVAIIGLQVMLMGAAPPEAVMMWSMVLLVLAGVLPEAVARQGTRPRIVLHIVLRVSARACRP